MSLLIIMFPKKKKIINLFFMRQGYVIQKKYEINMVYLTNLTSWKIDYPLYLMFYERKKATLFKVVF